VSVLRKLVDRMPLLDGCVIETTGIADPSPVTQTFLADDVLKEHCRLDAILTVVDCKHVHTQLAESRAGSTGASGRRAHLGINEAAQQISFADRVLLNKADLVSPAELEATRALVRGLNGTAKVFTTTRARGVELGELVGISAFDPTRHADAWGALEDDAVAVSTAGSGWPGQLEVRSHESNAVAAHSISCVGDLDLDAFNTWITELLRSKGDKIFRTKGILAAKGHGRKFVWQSVHMIFEGTQGDVWLDGEERTCRMVLIGVQLDAGELSAQFRACLVPTRFCAPCGVPNDAKSK